MYPRVDYEMSEKDLKELLNACKPVTAMMIGSYTPSAAPQQKANNAWACLGKKMGFDSDTVRPIKGKGCQFFSAVPTETESQKKDRLKRETEERRLTDIAKLKKEIAEKQAALANLDKDIPEPVTLSIMLHPPTKGSTYTCEEHFIEEGYKKCGP